MELVDSVDDPKSSCAVRGFQMPIFEVLDAKIGSALNRIIHHTQKPQGPFPSWKTDCSLDLRSLPGHDSVENYTDLFTVALRTDDIQEFDSKWDGILLSMTKIPSDDRIVQTQNTRV